MKKVFFALAILMAIAITATGCKSKSTPKTADSVAVEEADTLVTDSFSYHSEQDSTVYSTLRIDYPQGEGSLPMAVRKFIAHELSQLSLTATCTEEGNKKTADYSGSLDKAQQLVDFYGKCNMDFLVSMQKEVYEGMSGQKPEYAPRFNNELSLKKAYECEQYLTYAVLGYTYLGGAHGSAVDYHVNINKATGKPLTETVDTMKIEELQPILKKGIVSYIAPQDSEVTEKNLKNYLFLGENGLIPIPAHAPYLTPEGVCFKYQQYEIGPYAMGIIKFVVPFKDIKPFLLPEVQKLVK